MGGSRQRRVYPESFGVKDTLLRRQIFYTIAHLLYLESPMADAAYLNGLNEWQQSAVTAPLGNTLVLARVGEPDCLVG